MGVLASGGVSYFTLSNHLILHFCIFWCLLNLLCTTIFEVFQIPLLSFVVFIWSLIDFWYIAFGTVCCAVVIRCIPLPILEVEYFDVDGDRSDARRSCSMQLHGCLLDRSYCLRIRRETAIGAWITRWKNWRGCEAAEGAKSSFKTDMPYVLFFKEAIHERGLSEPITSLVVRIVRLVMQDAGARAYPSI